MSVHKLTSRGGIFTIAMKTVEDTPSHVLEIMKNFLIVDARTNFISKSIEYMGYSNLFRELKPGEEIPFYELVVSSTPHGLKVKANENGKIPDKIRKIRIMLPNNKPIDQDQESPVESVELNVSTLHARLSDPENYGF